MSTPLRAVPDGPHPSANLLTLADLTQPPYNFGRSARHLARKVRDGRLHAHRSHDASGVPWLVPEASAWSYARGDDVTEQRRHCPLCRIAAPPTQRRTRARRPTPP